MRVPFLFLIMLSLIFSLTACESDEDFIFDEIKIVENESKLLNQLNNNPWNNCIITEHFDVSDFSLWMKQSSKGSVQGAAGYREHLFQFQHAQANIYMYDLELKEYIGALQCISNGSFHCNNANFGKRFYQQSDLFPLLYVSQQNNKVHQTLVYRLVGDSITNLTPELVQTIIGPTPSDENHMYYQDCIIDGVNGYLYLYAHHKRDEQDSFHIVKYRLPDISESMVKLTDDDIYSSVFYDNQFSSPQGAVFHNDLLYIIKGVPAWKEQVLLDIVDFDKKQVCTVNLTEKGFKKEPEGIYFYGDTLICATNNGGIYCLNIVGN